MAEQMKLSFLATTASKIDELPIVNGQFILIKDTNTIAVDMNDKRTKYEQIITLASDSDRSSILAPVNGVFYFVVETNSLWKYDQGWKMICSAQSLVPAGGSSGQVLTKQSDTNGDVTGAESAVDGHIAIFDGATGKVIRDSEVSIDSLNDVIQKAHEHANKTQLDSFTKTQEEILSEASADAASKVSALSEEMEGKLAEKVDATTVDGKITTAKSEILESVDDKIGDLGESATVADYVTKVVGSGGADVAGQIDAALAEAKEYTDQSLTITEF